MVPSANIPGDPVAVLMDRTVELPIILLGTVGSMLSLLLKADGPLVWALVDLILIALRKLPDSDGRPLR